MILIITLSADVCIETWNLLPETLSGRKVLDKGMTAKCFFTLYEPTINFMEVSFPNFTVSSPFCFLGERRPKGERRQGLYHDSKMI